MIAVVLGLGFGDEGKGMVTARLVSHAKNSPLVIRFNGGHQAGHTVIKDGHRHVFSSFGSGTLHGAPTYWSQFCTVYPTALMNEYDKLKLHFNPEIYIDPMCPITTPYDVEWNHRTNNHGSVGVGFGATLQRQEHHYTLYAKDLKYPRVLEMKLQQIASYYNTVHVQIEGFLEDIRAMLEVVNIWRPSFSRDLIFEGAQGILLDQRFGFFPHVTRSNTTSQNVWDLLPSECRNSISVSTYLVTRAYQTRHGAGPMTFGKENISVRNDGETNVFNEHQGNFRVAPFDHELINYAIDCDRKISNNPKKIIMTCCDQIDTTPEIDTVYPVSYNYSAEGDFLVEPHVKKKIL